ncbi:MAG: hypothetical protein LBI92_09265, partial [Azoarcus sp.]|nr:hypothetical protein [Azoarcus sp.]
MERKASGKGISGIGFFANGAARMPANLSGTQIVRVDEGGANARIIARVAKVDFRRIEAASIKMKACIASAEGKRLFVRYFSSLQLHAHFISVIAPLRLDAAEVEKM